MSQPNNQYRNYANETDEKMLNQNKSFARNIAGRLLNQNDQSAEREKQ